MEEKNKAQNNNKIHLFIIGLLYKFKDNPFRIVWYFFIAFLGVALLSRVIPCGYGWMPLNIITRFALVIFIIVLVWRPMNVVYGLIGTKGNISSYIVLLIVINVIFSCLYYGMIFRNAGITYDINQPHIAYSMFRTVEGDSFTFKKHTVAYSYDLSGQAVSYTVNKEVHNYQKIEYWYVLKNTFMTSLMQEPSDFFAIASTYNEGVDDEPEAMRTMDKQKSELFHWLLILQVFISWIFFGVFISILYNKFRYES